MYTANTMAAVAEAMGMSLPGSASPAERRPPPRRLRPQVRRGRRRTLRRGITAPQIMTKEAFENAIAVVMAFGGSTNAVLHLMAIAHEATSTCPWTTSAGSARASRTWRRQAVRLVRHDGRRPVGGVPVVMRPCSTPACCTATPSPSPAGPSRRTSPT
jgi:dihydroxy-acid dehydratase